MMKKVFFAFAIAGMFGFAACGSNNTEAVDTLAEEVAIVEEAAEQTMDSTVEAAVEEVATEAVAE